MRIEILAEDFDKELYNRVAPHPLQSWQWGEARKAMGTEVLRLGEFDGEELQNVYQITFHPIPKFKFKVAYLPRSVWPSQELLEFMQDYGKKNNVIFLKFEPDVKKNTHDFSLNSSLLIQASPHPLFPNWTQVMDISPTEEELLAKMHPKTRYNIRLATKKGVTVKEESNEEGFKTFSKLYFETTKRQKYFGHTPKYHQIVWDTMKEGLGHILIAYYEGVPLAAYELFYFHDRLYYPYGGSSDQHRNVMAANLIMWEAIRLGKQLGAKDFDMWGSLAPDYDPNDPWSGFTRFKEGYGAEFVEMVGSYDMVINPTLYHVYNHLHTLRQFVLQFRR